MVAYEVDEFHPTEAADDEFRTRWEAVVAFDAEMEPEDPPTPFDKHRQQLTDRPSFQRPRLFTAWAPGRSSALAIAEIDLEYTDSNRHLAWCSIGVRPEARRQGIGTELLARVVEAAVDDGRTILGTFTIDGSDGDAFCTRFGFEPKATERKSRLVLADVDRTMLEGWVSRAVERAADYEVFRFDDRCPDDLVEPFVELWKVTNTAPRDNLDMDDEVMTPEHFREREEKALARGDSVWRSAVRQRSTGALAGFTELFFAPHAPEVSWQGWTAVDPGHRNLGIGRWLKADNCLRLMDERPTVRFVDTWNAFSNAPMLGINIEMGFDLVRGYTDWQAPVDTLRSALKAAGSLTAS